MCEWPVLFYGQSSRAIENTRVPLSNPITADTESPAMGPQEIGLRLTVCAGDVSATHLYIPEHPARPTGHREEQREVVGAVEDQLVATAT